MAVLLDTVEVIGPDRGGWLNRFRSGALGTGVGRTCAVFAATRASGDDVLHDVAVDVGEAEVATGVAVGELLVIETKQVEDGGVQVVHVDLVLDGGESELVGRAV